MKAISKHYKKIILSLFVLGLITGIVLYQKTKQKKAHSIAKSKPIPVKVMTLHPSEIAINTSATGYLKAISDATITSRVSGYISKIPYHEGSTVKKGALLFQLDNKKERNALAAAKANNALSEFQYKRNKMLLKKGFITQPTYFTSEVTMKQNQAALKTAQTNLSDKAIKAPFSGTIGEINTSLGNYVTPGQTITTIVNDRQLRVDYTLPATDLSRIHLNQTVVIKTAATQEKTFGKVTFISPTVNEETQTISLEATLNNKQHHYKPGEFVTLSQHIGENKKVLLIPEQSIRGSINGYSAYVVQHNKAVEKEIRVGKHIKGKVVVLSGLTPNEKIIIAGQNEVFDGQSVTVTNL